MPRKTLLLLIGLVLVTIVLFFIALKTGQQQNQQQATAPQLSVQPTLSEAHSVLAMSPNPVQLMPGQTGSVAVTIDPSDNQVTAVQLELMYDPAVLSNVQVTYGALFTNPLVLINKNNPTTGKYTYAFGIQPSQQPITTKGVAANITFTTKGTVGQQAQITLLPESLVTARGVADSVLKMGNGTTIMLGPAATAPKATSPAVTVSPAGY
ncbi:MAG TPA: cohesin domain-containing protein [Patescibacteria group bacterium]